MIPMKESSKDALLLNRLLENELSRLMPLKHYLLCAYARNGLYLLIKSLCTSKNDEIIVPAFTCFVVPKSIMEAGAVPVFVDSEENGLNIDPDKISQAITKNTRAIYVIHTYGTAAKIDDICSIARKRGLYVIEDIAHSLFCTYKGRLLGTYGDFAVISFNKKVINYEGGAIGTNNTEIYRKMLVLQQQYPKNPPMNGADRTINIARFVGSVWESRFSLMAMMLLKLSDILNEHFFHNYESLKIDDKRFHMRSRAMRLALKQIRPIQRKNSNNRYLTFRKHACNKIKLVHIHRTEGDRLPEYYAGILERKSPLYTALSFRTWINFDKPGMFPRADYLYKHFRILSWLALSICHLSGIMRLKSKQTPRSVGKEDPY
jgi:hypothetical protein